MPRLREPGPWSVHFARILQKTVNGLAAQFLPAGNGGQFCDRGHSYTSAIHYFTDKQKRLAKASRQTLIYIIVYALM